MENDEALRLRISKELKAGLQKLADKENRKLSDFIRLELIKLVQKEPKKK
jgi:mRNA-degrading endonuclease RelE of RelBE toxin-antitoxin system